MKPQFEIPSPSYKISRTGDSALLLEFFRLFSNAFTLHIVGCPDAKVLEELSAIADRVGDSDYLVCDGVPGKRFEFDLGARDLEPFRRFIDTHAEPEYCSFAVVLDSERTLLSWYNFPDDPIYVAMNADLQIVEQIAAFCSSEYRIVNE